MKFRYAALFAAVFALAEHESLPWWEAALAASAFVSAVFGYAEQLVWLWNRFLGLFLVTARVDDQLVVHLAAYLHESSVSKRRPREPEYVQGFYWVKSLTRLARVVAENLPHALTSYYWVSEPGKKWRRPLWLVPRRDDDNDLLGSAVARFPRGFDFPGLLCRAAGWKDEVAEGRHKVVVHHGSVGDSAGKETSPSSQRDRDTLPVGWRPLNYDAADVGSPSASAASHLALPPESAQLLGDAKKWLDMRPWYQERQVAHRRGYLIIGPPGTGKTTLVREVSAQLDLPVHVVDLATHTNQDLTRTWQKIAADAPCAVLVEDVDGVFKGRVPAPGVKLTFDALLNSLDGVARRDGVALFLTTNDPDSLDPALVRPGRVDFRVTVGPLKIAQRVELAVKFLGDDPEVRQLAVDTGDIPAAAFVERCLALAHKRMWGTEDGAPTVSDAHPQTHSPEPDWMYEDDDE